MAASGAFASMSTTKLLTVEEMLEALRGVGRMAHCAPGAASLRPSQAALHGTDAELG